MLKRLILFAFLLIAYNNNAESKESFYSSADFSAQPTDSLFFHTVESGQTVYAISVMYQTTVESIYQLNPKSREGIKVGDRLTISQKTPHIVYHTIEPKETLYAVSKKYNVSGEAILEANPGLSISTFTIGKNIMIPIYKEKSIGIDGKTVADESDVRVNNLLQQLDVQQNLNVINVALLLPFGTIDADSVNHSLSQRFIEYYEGFLLALDTLKRVNVSVNLSVYDIGHKSSSLKKVLDKNELKENHLLIGGHSEAQITQISQYAKANSVRYVIPFTSRSDETMLNPFIFQSNPPQAYQHSKVSQAFVKKYKKHHVVFIDMNDYKDKANLTKMIQSELKAQNISFQKVTYSSKTFGFDLFSALDSDKNNVLVLSSGTSEALIRLVTPLRMLRETGLSKEVSLFGYPEWQTYTRDYLEDFHTNRACIYSVFYANNTSPELKAFQRLFRIWYSKSMTNSFPRYGILGYDTGMFFLQMINNYGTEFENHLSDFQYDSLQTGYNFTRVSNWGGFINTNVFWVEYDSDYSIKREVAQ